MNFSLLVFLSSGSWPPFGSPFIIPLHSNCCLFHPPSVNQLRRWVTVSFGRDVMLTLHYCGESCQSQTEQPYGLLACCAPSGNLPNGGLMRFILDESHQNEVITYPLSVNSFSSQVETMCGGRDGRAWGRVIES